MLIIEGFLSRFLSNVLYFAFLSVSVDQIKEIQNGSSSDLIKNKEFDAVYQEEYRFTILYGNSYTPLELVAKTPDEANIWIAGLSYLITRRENNQQRHQVSNNSGMCTNYVGKCIVYSVLAWFYNVLSFIAHYSNCRS